jgi:hypothetical protein
LKVPNNNIGEKRLLISTIPDQKETYRIKKTDGTYGSLFLGFKEWKLDGWEGNPTLGKALMDCDEIRAGDYVLTSHNAFQNERMQIQRHDLDKFNAYDLEPDEQVFSIPKSFCWIGIRGEGEMFCIGASLICDRVYEPAIETTLIIDDRKKMKNFVQVKQIPDNPSMYFTEDNEICMTEISVGDIIAVHKNADVEHKYVWENEPRSLIRVNFHRDFLGIRTEGLKYEL